MLFDYSDVLCRFRKTGKKKEHKEKVFFFFNDILCCRTFFVKNEKSLFTVYFNLDDFYIFLFVSKAHTYI